MAATMTEEEFQALRPDLGRLTVKSLDVAKLVLVEGTEQAEVARQFKLSPQRVSDIVSRVQATADKVPHGWERVVVWLPPEDAKKVKVMATTAMDHHDEGNAK